LLKTLFAAYTETLTPGTKEASTHCTETIHTKHLVRLLGEDQQFGAVGRAIVQDYVDARAVLRISTRSEWHGYN
jgi:hypothetical protein